eukprot:scaffold214_cov249-Pinguiococcus_pyrenoidosus.AAC.32
MGSAVHAKIDLLSDGLVVTHAENRVRDQLGRRNGSVLAGRLLLSGIPAFYQWHPELQHGLPASADRN